MSFKNWPKDRAKRREKFVREYLRIPRGAGVGKPFRLQPFQQEITRGAFAPGIRTALVSIPRANGKTAYAAAMALAECFVGPESAEVLTVASDRAQAGHVLKYAKAMVAKSPELSARVVEYSDRLVIPENDAVILPLPAEPGALHGYDPSLLIVDELHVVTEAVWEAATSVVGKRPPDESLTLAISTPATSPDSVMWRLVEHGRVGDDPSFYLKEFCAPDGCAKDDRAAWRAANPAMTCPQAFLAEDGMLAAMRTLREPVFRQLRLGQWVSGIDAWLPWGAWDACLDSTRTVKPGERVTFGFDGSVSGDCTALVGCTMDGHVWVEGLWENPRPGDHSYRIPRVEVLDAIDAAFARYDVAEIAFDPAFWRTDFERLQGKYGERRVIQYDTNVVTRMAPANDRFYAAVMDRKVSHDGDDRLSAHMAHCTAERTMHGDTVRKDRRNSPRKIDAAIGAIIAYDRAMVAANNTTENGVWFF
ncbi:terminase large subunit domain-containing protein [Mycolicibacterium palauense]|uniref:terminase large subunit domain-containing protein n=1 Tax=Mycolicibacterium palauense TaxID=2034511 RepID=UPI001FE25BF5|nr:terminase large subunit [Mycolicibacterium palauense]